MTRHLIQIKSISILNMFYTRCSKVDQLECIFNQSRVELPTQGRARQDAVSPVSKFCS